MKTVIVIISMMFCTPIFAQTNYYEVTKTFNENGYTYQCDVRASKTVTLYNKSNRWTYTRQIYKSSGKAFAMPDIGIDLFDDASWARACTKRFAIVNNAFSKAEKQRVKGHEFIISMYIDPNTGKVSEVNFEFGNFQPYATIPVSVYWGLEMELKNNLWFTPTVEGKKLNYILFWWGQEPK